MRHGDSTGDRQQRRIYEIDVRAELIDAIDGAAKRSLRPVALVSVELAGEYPETSVIALLRCPELGPCMIGKRFCIWDEPGLALEIGAGRFATYSWLEIDEFLLTTPSARYAEEDASHVIWIPD